MYRPEPIVKKEDEVCSYLGNSKGTGMNGIEVRETGPGFPSLAAAGLKYNRLGRDRGSMPPAMPPRMWWRQAWRSNENFLRA